MNKIDHAEITSWNREFYSVEINPKNGDLSVEKRVLNIFERVLRYFFGEHENTIFSQHKIDELASNHPLQSDEVQELVDKLNQLGKNLIFNPPAHENNVLIVGRSKSGKTN